MLDVRLLWKNPDVVSFVFAVFVGVVVVVSWALKVGLKQGSYKDAGLVIESARTVTIAAPASDEVRINEVGSFGFARSDDDLEGH